VALLPDMAGLPYSQDLLVLGLTAQLVGGLLLGSSAEKGRPRSLLLNLLGGTPPSLSFLRDALHAKTRGQAGAAFFVLGSGLLLVGFLRPGGPGDWRVEAGGVVLLLGLAVAFLQLADNYVGSTLRRYLRDHFREHPDFPFERHIALTREIGQLFGVEGGAEETLESYVRKVRVAMGLADPPSRILRRPGGPARAGG